jgi:RIO kinase 1
VSPRASRRRFDDDDFHDQQLSRARDDAPDLPHIAHTPDLGREPDDPDEPSWSTYPDAAHGPEPVPDWVITSPAAVDTDLGVLKTGKEAEVSLLRRDLDRRGSLLAVKRYRAAHHRNFHRDAVYLEGRRMRYSRENRAMDTRTEFGRSLIAGQWAVAEFAVLGRLWSEGIAVPYPVQLIGTELMMEFIGDADGVAAPRLAQLRPDRAGCADLFEQLRTALLGLARAGYTHGDLSAYNVLVHDGRLVLIDVPQAVDVVGNAQGFALLERDCRNIVEWFDARGLPVDVDGLVRDLRAAALS